MKTPDDTDDAIPNPFAPTPKRSAGPVVEAPFDDGETRVRPVSSAVDPLIGATLGESTVLAPLGSGAMGLVYRGEQPATGRPVAIKVLKRDFAADPNYLRRFIEEARSLSACRHPGIVDIFDFGTLPSGEPYLVMELIEGESLEAFLAREGALPPATALSIIIPLCSALSAAHAAGIIHRDLKPANIVLVKLADGTTFPKLLDFGLARRGEGGGAKVRQTSIGGTPLYIAPEQARGEEISAQTDLYSLGCVLSELLVGQPPFTSGNLMELLDQHASLAPVPIRQVRKELPVALEALVLELLAKKQADRPASADEVKRRLEGIQLQLTLATAPAERPPRRITRPEARTVREPIPQKTVKVDPVTEEADAIPRAAVLPGPRPVTPPARSKTGLIIAALLLIIVVLVGLLLFVPKRATETENEPPRWHSLQKRVHRLPHGDTRKALQRVLAEAKGCNESVEACAQKFEELERLLTSAEANPAP